MLLSLGWFKNLARTPRRALAPHIAALLIVAAAFTSSCFGSLTDPKGSKTPATLIVVQGAGQSGQVGRDLAVPIVLRVLDSTGAAVAGVTVRLSISAGGGSVTPASDTTNAKGEFTAKWTLGPNTVSQEILAAVPGVTPVAINATGLQPVQIILVQGNNQTAKAGSVLTNSIVVRVVGAANMPMVGVTVGFQVLAGGGGMTPATVVTNALGEASTKWTVGAAGGQAGLVVSGSLLTVQLFATAAP